VQKQALEEARCINKHVFIHNFSKIASEKIFLGCLSEYGKIIGVVKRNLFFFNRLN
jgi:hypothetical protein